MSSTSAVFVGSGSLLIQCAQAWRDAGNVISAVATHSAEILAWAETSGINATRIDATSSIEIPVAEFDYLFSVANLEVLPSALTGRARKLAINFHDGPLPRYAG